jgi:glycosyltransferase involved in cell wall biosynthesis
MTLKFKISSEVIGKSVAFLSTYPPRDCGIASFTKDLADAINLDQAHCFVPTVIAINDEGEINNYDQRVKWSIDCNSPKDYRQLADEINVSDVKLVNVQHEFGIFGGENGEYITRFYDAVKKPIVTTLHTVVPNFSTKQLAILEQITQRSEAIVIITSIAQQLLERQGIHSKNYVTIPHGCPQMEFVDTSSTKKVLGLDNRFVISTFGLISPMKGIEYVIRALPKTVEKAPNLLYLIIGETHPDVRKREGEQYRNELTALVCDLGLSQYVRFYNRFLPRHELIRYLQATDVYITPYLMPGQISSGALTYALGAGKAVISTPYLHAQELLANNLGIFCKFQDSDSIAEGISVFLNDDYRIAMQKRVYACSRRFLWRNIAMLYCELFNTILKANY